MAEKKPSILSLFARYYKPHLALFSADLAAALLLAGCDLVYPTITRNIINTYPQKRVRYDKMVANSARWTRGGNARLPHRVTVGTRQGVAVEYITRKAG